MFSDIKHLHAAHVVSLKCQENTAGQFNSTRQCCGTWQPSTRWNLFCLWNSRTALLYDHFNRQWGRCGETKTSNSQINDTKRGVLFFFLSFFRLVNKNIPKLLPSELGNEELSWSSWKWPGITWQPTQQFLILLQIKIQAWWECSAADRAYKCHTDKATSGQMTHCSFFTHLSDVCKHLFWHSQTSTKWLSSWLTVSFIGYLPSAINITIDSAKLANALSFMSIPEWLLNKTELDLRKPHNITIIFRFNLTGRIQTS